MGKYREDCSLVRLKGAKVIGCTGITTRKERDVPLRRKRETELPRKRKMG